jgi:hypothetical protein
MLYSIKERTVPTTAADRASRLRLLGAGLSELSLGGEGGGLGAIEGGFGTLEILAGDDLSLEELLTFLPIEPPHSSTVLSWSEHGKTRLRTLPPGERAHLQQLTENYRRFRQARAALVKLQRRMLATIDRLERALRLPPPKPAAQRRKR